MDLLTEAQQAAGGLDSWRRKGFISARLRQGGGLWAAKGQAGVLDDVRVEAALHQEWVSHRPFGAPDRRSSFTPQRAMIETLDGQPVSTLDDPRPTFSNHSFETPWSTEQLAYFVGTAMWTYLTQPFVLSLPGFHTEELEPLTQDETRLRRLQVTWPDYLATHSTTQTLYFGDDGLLARHDYEVEIVAGAPAAHFLTDFQAIEGIVMPTKHRIYPRDENGEPQKEMLIVSIDLDDIQFGQP
jgi:hypothetical protein